MPQCRAAAMRFWRGSQGKYNALSTPPGVPSASVGRGRRMKTLKDIGTMTISNRALALAAAALALTFAGPAAAQDDYDQGKTGPQLFASDCGICHEAPRGLMKTVNPSGLQSFLSEHYNASSHVAARIAATTAAYPTTVDQAAPGPAPASSRAAKKPKGAEAAKSGDKSAGEKKPDAKASDAKPSDAKASDTKPADSGTSDKP